MDERERREVDRLYERLNALEQKIDSHDQRMRQEIAANFSRLGSQFGGQYQVVVGRVEDHHSRLILLEEQRRVNEERRALIEKDRDRRSGVFGAIMGAGVSAIFQIIRSMVTK